MKVFGEVKKKTVSREAIIWCYRTLLGREPESEAAILSHAPSKSLKDLVECFVRSPEFLAKTAAAKATPARDDRRLGTTGLIGPKQNEALAMAEFAAGVLVVNSSPRMLTLETTSRCNLRCVMCPHAIDAVDRPKHLEEEMVAGLEKFIRQSRSIQLHGIGEPLASPAFWTSLKFLPEGCDSSINTNLTVLDERRLKSLVGSQLKIINVSLDAARPETYRKIRGYSFEEVLENIRRFVEERRASGKRFPLLYINMTLMRSNIEEVLEFIDLAAGLGADTVCFWHLNRWSDGEMQRYVVERDGWVFDYRKEGLWNFPALSNEYLRKAEALAREKGIRLYLDNNKLVYFDEQETDLD
jgi:sulfatase maturation enzyme AslB (radical SAM superfamily)